MEHKKTFKYTIYNQNLKMACFNDKGKNLYNSEMSYSVLKSIVNNLSQKILNKGESARMKKFFTNPQQ